ncbi:MAG: condensation domain-containing protein, partial [Waddliaceae bacterium]
MKVSEKNMVSSRKAFPLSSSQEQMWLLWKLAPSEPTYNVGIAFSIKTALEPDCILNALKKLIEKYSIFRTVYRDEDGDPISYVRHWDDVHFKRFCTFTLSIQKHNPHSFVSRSFDLEEGPLFHCDVLHHDGDTIVTWIFHHIVIDEWSIPIVLRDFQKLIDDPVVDIGIEAYPYHKFFKQQQKYLASNLYNQQISFWKTKLKGITPPYLPFDQDHQVDRLNTEGKNIQTLFSKQILDRLNQCTKELRSTHFQVLLLIVSLLISKYSRSKTFAIGTATANRVFPKSHLGVGYFVNPLVLRIDLNSDQRACEFLQEIQSTILEAMESEPSNVLRNLIWEDLVRWCQIFQQRRHLYQKTILLGSFARD